GFLLLTWVEPPPWTMPTVEMSQVHMSRETPAPDETASSGISPSPSPGQGQADVTKTEKSEATDSRRPAKSEPTSPAEEKDEYILEREPDGRYRIIGRRPRKPE